MSTPTTKPSTQKLSDAARHVRAPSGAVTSGWPAVERKCRDLGIRFRWWQKPIGKLILAKRSDGTYAATVGGTGMSIPRQVGKTFLVGAIVFALCLLRPGLTVIWTAHRVRTAEETFKKMQAFAKRKRIAPHVSKLILGSGEESVEFHNGSRIMFGARATGFGRGFDEVDVLIFDEAQILTEAALDDMIPATNQSRQETSALLLFMGTPPKPTDPGEVFTRMRSEALSGEDEDTAWIEFGADEDYDPTPPPADLSPADWKQIEKANPSFPEDTPRVAILRMRKKLGADSFRREGMGIWDKPKATADRPVTVDAWAARAESPTIPEGAPDYFSLSISPERIGFIGVAFRGEDVDFVDLAEAGRVDDSRRIVEWFAERRKGNPRLTVAIDTRDPAAALVNDLRAARIKVNVTTLSDSVKACMGLADAVEDEQVDHVDQPAVREALLVARKKPIGKAGQWEFDPDDDIAALRAITLARYGLTFKKKRTGEGRRTGTRRGVVLS